MATLGKAFWGPKGKSFEALEKIEARLEEKTGHKSSRTYSDFYTRAYSRQLRVDETYVTFTYNSSLPGYGTIRWKGRNATVEAIVLEVAQEMGITKQLPFEKAREKGEER